MSCWLFKKTTQVIFVSNSEKDSRARIPLKYEALMQKEDDDTNVFMKNIHERYAHRPKELEGMCLAEFATQYTPMTKEPSKQTIEKGSAIPLQDDFGWMRKRSKPLILRTHSFPEHSSEFFLGKLLLFFPWRNEDQLKRPDQTYQERYNEVFEVIELNSCPFNLNRKEIELALNDFKENGIVETDWEKTKDISEEEEKTYTMKNVCEDLKEEGATEDEAGQHNCIHPLIALYKTEGRKKVLSDGSYYEKRRRLNKEQREIVEYNRQWVKDQIFRLKKGQSLKGYKVFLSGPGGTGKSTVIELIHRDITELFRACFVRNDNTGFDFDFSPDDPTSLLTAFTGTASFNINGSTMHSLFQLMKQTIPHEKKSIMMTRLRQLKQVTIDEISMVKKNHLDMINDRCSMIRNQNANDQNFGNIAILAVGDLFQLSPVGGRPVFEHGNITKPSDFAPLLWDQFYFHELTQVMRQKDDFEFAMLLNSIRKEKPEENSREDKLLKAREMVLKESDEGYPHFVLHVYATNNCAKARNERILDKIDGRLF